MELPCTDACRLQSQAQLTLLEAHEDGGVTTLLGFVCKHSVCSHLQVWDVRRLKAPMHVYGGLPAHHASTGVIFSPDERLLLTGVSAGRDGTGGALVIIDRARHEIVRRLAMPSSVVAVCWHERLNQIFLGIGRVPWPCVPCPQQIPKGKYSATVNSSVLLQKPHSCPELVLPSLHA